MAVFSQESLDNLKGVHPILVNMLMAITIEFDCHVIGGVRSKEEQEEDVRKHLSETMQSMHLIQADGFGHAVDVAPTPMQWDNSPPSELSKYEVQCIAFLFYVKGYAKAKGVNLRIGADWNGNNLWTDNKFNDLDHIELPNA